ncbi:hypothetical protein IID27_01855 [Patescibacteria group bacterium]|nr:hypothetical protein [Patescibacteria group bacterium]
MNAVVNHQPTSYKRAREIMGINNFGAEEVIKHFGVNLSRAALSVPAEVPFSEEVLENCRDTHILNTFSPAILDIRRKVERKLFYLHENAWYNKKTFAQKRGPVGCHLICKTIVEDSLSRSLKEQQVFLSKGDKTPPAEVMVCTIIGHYMNTGERLFPNVYVRTSTVFYVRTLIITSSRRRAVWSRRRVDVGRFDRDGLDIHFWRDDYRCDVIGLSSAKVPMLKS